MHRLIVLIAALTLGSSAQPVNNSTRTNAQKETAKPAWRWTVDERIAARHDAAAAADRVRATHPSAGGALRATSASESVDQVDFLSGRDHPELLMSWEIFDHMMRSAYADQPDVRSDYREVRARNLAAVGLSADFWARLEVLSAPYLSDTRQLRDLHKRPVTDAAVRKRISDESESLGVLLCRDRADAMAVARQAFGDKFDRFLYEGVAPSMGIAVTRGGVIPEAREREIERGCR